MSRVSEYLKTALERLDKELKEAKGVNRHAGVMAEPVAKQLRAFCKQEPEFAQAVVQGGSFKECMVAVSKGAGSALSDMEAYERAVRFYFPGARVQFQIKVDLVGDANKKVEEPDAVAPAAPTPTAKTGIVLSLADFLR